VYGRCTAGESGQFRRQKRPVYAGTSRTSGNVPMYHGVRQVADRSTEVQRCTAGGNNPRFWPKMARTARTVRIDAVANSVRQVYSRCPTEGLPLVRPVNYTPWLHLPGILELSDSVQTGSRKRFTSLSERTSQDLRAANGTGRRLGQSLLVLSVGMGLYGRLVLYLTYGPVQYGTVYRGQQPEVPIEHGAGHTLACTLQEHAASAWLLTVQTCNSACLDRHRPGGSARHTCANSNGPSLFVRSITVVLGTPVTAVGPSRLHKEEYSTGPEDRPSSILLFARLCWSDCSPWASQPAVHCRTLPYTSRTHPYIYINNSR